MKRITEERGRLIWHMREDSSEDLKIEDFCTKVESDDDLYRMPFGAVIDAQGEIWRLKHYGTHGCVAAILCPDIAEEFGVYQPRANPPHFAFQEFELECKHWMPLIRISTRFDVAVSFGRCEAWPSPAQLDSLVRFLRVNDLWYSKIITELSREHASPGGRGLVGTIMRGEPDPLHNESLKEINKQLMEKEPEKYKVFDPAEWY